ncbi:hypothetical protein K1719_033424 [Acacia pycnantha]|nr:hypothetical protein K1719_033424 [Acacia pycnantha]
MLSCCGSGPFENAMASDWAEMVDGFQKSALESRLGIPLIYGIDVVHGNNTIGEEGTPGYIGPRLILFGGATALEGNSTASGTPSLTGNVGIRLFYTLVFGYFEGTFVSFWEV